MKKICIVSSRGLADKVKRHISYIKSSMSEPQQIEVLSRRVSVFDDKGNFMAESKILEQKLQVVKECDILHVLWDGVDPDAATIIGMGLAFGKEVVSYYVAPVGIRKYLWEVRNKSEEHDAEKQPRTRNKVSRPN